MSSRQSPEWSESRAARVLRCRKPEKHMAVMMAMTCCCCYVVATDADDETL